MKNNSKQIQQKYITIKPFHCLMKLEDITEKYQLQKIPKVDAHITIIEGCGPNLVIPGH